MSDAPVPPGGPRIPRGKPSFLVLFYGTIGVLSLGTYLASAVLGWGSGSEQRDAVPASVRQAPGGYRTYHFWHSGYQGGK